MSRLNDELKEASQLMHSADISELMDAFAVRRHRRAKEPWRPNEVPTTWAEPQPKENAPARGRRV